MSRRPRRARSVPRVEALERRTLLSGERPGRELFVRFRPDTPLATIERVIERVGGEVVEAFPQGPQLVQFDSLTQRDAAAALLAGHPRVRYVQPNQRVKVQAQAHPSAAQEFSRQWGLHQGNGPDIDALDAWKRTTGDPDTIVAVIDSGIDLKHPEFAGRVWTNPNEVPGDRVDNDRNGYVDDVHGWNYVNRNGNVQDVNEHGTHVAGTIAAAGIRVAGVNPKAQIMPLKMIDRDGYGDLAHAVRAVYYAVDHGARVINASWSGADWSRAMADAIRYAMNASVVFVAAAGNEGTNNDRVPSYPANAGLANVVSVAALTSSGRLADFSNFGRRSVALAAPGSNIYSTVPGGYRGLSGTSMAAPFVTGVVSLLVGRAPLLSARQIVARVMATVQPLSGLRNRVATGGMVNAARVLSGQVASRVAARAAGVATSTPPVTSLRALAAGADF